MVTIIYPKCLADCLGQSEVRKGGSYYNTISVIVKYKKGVKSIFYFLKSLLKLTLSIKKLFAISHTFYLISIYGVHTVYTALKIQKVISTLGSIP